MSSDFDPWSLAPLKRAFARVKANNKLGSGFLVDGPKIRTCAHVLEGLEPGAQVQCSFGDSRDSVEFRIESIDPAADVAYLVPGDEAVLPQVEVPKRAVSRLEFMRWWSWGFPAFAKGYGVTLRGDLLDPDKTWDGRQCYELASDDLVGEDVQLGGFSGSAVLVGSEIVAMIYKVLAGEGDGKRTRLGRIYALPLVKSSSVTGGASPPPAPIMPIAGNKPTPDEKQQLQLLNELYSASSAAEVARVLGAWNDTAHMPPKLPLIAAERIIGMGEPRIALKLLDPQEDSVRKIELEALAQSLLGKHDKAQALLKRIDVVTPESGGISGGILKRRYLETKDRALLQGAYDQYEQAYELSRDPYPGINAAATALWLGNKDVSLATAREVVGLVEARPKAERNCWDWVTLGEAYLLAGEFEKALAGYGKAVALAPMDSRNIAIMRKQARISLKLLGQPANLLDPVLVVGGVACFTGHRVDEADRPVAGFPRAKVADVARRIRAIIEQRQIRFGYASAAGGADLLFIEQLLACGGMPSIFLPFPRERFVETSVGEGWKTRFVEALKNVPATNVHVLSDSIPASQADEDAAYAACNRAIRAAAIEGGRIYDEQPVMIAVIAAEERERASPLTGGTAEAVRDWAEGLHGDLEIIDPKS